ncbi:MAG: hypothetical protein ACOY94_21860 [Bacillota bacterium]
MTNRRIRFNVRESIAVDPDWEVDKAIDLWERMLGSRLKALADRTTKKKQDGASE